MAELKHIPVALTIAGSDSGGGAGIQADLRTFAALRVFGTSAVTLITVQNTRDVARVDILAPDLVAAQIDAVMTDFEVRAVKTGALGSADIVKTVAAKVDQYRIDKLVVDPVMISKHGHALIERGARDTLIHTLFPRALLITPNAYEAAAILGVDFAKLGAPRDIAFRLGDTGARAALLKGGHLADDRADDYLWDGADVHVIAGERIDTPHTHGTGCTLSAAIAAYLARGCDLLDAVTRAKAYTAGALRAARAIGAGISPTHHMFEYYHWE